MKGILMLALALSATGARADGVVQGQDIAKKIVAALGDSTLECTSGNDWVTLNVDQHGDLRMVAHYSGAISGDLDTDNEGYGEECGGLTATTNAKYSTYLLDDSYNDCERGWWGFRIALPEDSLTAIQSGDGEFKAVGYAQDQGTIDGKAETFDCTVN